MESANIYSLLLVAGQLKALKKELQEDGSYLCEVAIPNRDIAVVYKGDIFSLLFCHGLVLGFVVLMDNQYKIKSNRESGAVFC